MPATLSTNQFVVVTGPGVIATPAPASPNRKLLTIQNTGPAAGLFRLGGPVRNDNGDVVFAVGEKYTWAQPGAVPLESLNFASTVATTWAVIEGIG